MPLKKSQSNLWSTLLNRIFISHAYDESEIKAVLRRLPEHVTPAVFSRQDPNPYDAVSNEIVTEIRSCRGLINLVSARSKKSLWVNFERDYALRSGLKVFAFDAERRMLHEDFSSPVSLCVELVIGKDDVHQ